MIGQSKLMNKLNQYTVDTFPRSIILLGEKGSGKHLISNYIKDNILKFDMMDISETVSDEVIDQIYRTPNPMIYLVDISNMTEKEQNILLKFVEEPLKNAFIILLCEDRNVLLNTIANRCITFELESYTKEQLSTFIKEDDSNKDLILNIIRTPGKILSLNLDNLNDIYDVCDKIVNKLNIASYPNTLTIVDKINYKDEYNKFDIGIFFDTLIYKLFDSYKMSNNENIFKMYIYSINERKKLVDKRINKELFMTNYLTNLWKLVRE